MKILSLEKRVARRLRAEMEDHGGVVEFCEKLVAFPDQYITDLAVAAIDEMKEPPVDI